MEENYNNIKVFDKCPGCGSAERYFESILNELKARGLLDNKISSFDFQMQQGIALPQSKIALLPFGSEIPAFNRVWDTCLNCGMVYSTRLEKATAKKSIDVAPLQNTMPNRAERRQIVRDFRPNNPLLS